MIKNIYFKKTILFAICAMSSNLVMADYRYQITVDSITKSTKDALASNTNNCKDIPGTYPDCKERDRSRKGCISAATKYCYICGGKTTSQLDNMTSLEERNNLCKK